MLRRCAGSLRAFNSGTGRGGARPAGGPAAAAGEERPAWVHRDLYLSELSPGTQANEIHQLMSREGRVRSVTMHFASNGAFARTAAVRFATFEELDRTLQAHATQGFLLNGVHVKVSRSGEALRGLAPNRPVAKGPGTQVFISNLSYSTSPDQIKAAFSSFGEVLDVIMFQRDGQPMGMGKVLFARETDAKAAVAGLNEASFDGRTMFLRIDSRYVSTGDAIAAPATAAPADLGPSSSSPPGPADDSDVLASDSSSLDGVLGNQYGTDDDLQDLLKNDDMLDDLNMDADDDLREPSRRPRL